MYIKDNKTIEEHVKETIDMNMRKMIFPLTEFDSIFPHKDITVESFRVKKMLYSYRCYLYLTLRDKTSIGNEEECILYINFGSIQELRKYVENFKKYNYCVPIEMSIRELIGYLKENEISEGSKATIDFLIAGGALELEPEE